MLAWEQISHVPHQKSQYSDHSSFCSARASTSSHPVWRICENTWEGTNRSFLIVGIQDISSTRQLNKSCLLYTPYLYTRSGPTSLLKIKIQGQEEVATGPSSEEINHFFIQPALWLLSHWNQRRFFCESISWINKTWSAQPQGSLATTSSSLLTICLLQQHWANRRYQMPHLASSGKLS